MAKYLAQQTQNTYHDVFHSDRSFALCSDALHAGRAVYNEPHHLRKLPNRLDYAIKMKEYMDHYLKGEPAPEWITDGVPYRD